MSDKVLEKVISLSKRRGFVTQSSEIYGGLAATYDYGPLGVELKRNIRELWWHAMTRRHSNVEGLDAAILMHPAVWKASGHVDAFHDPMIDDKASKMRYRADQLIEGQIAKLRKAGKEVEATNLAVRLTEAMNSADLCVDLHQLIMEYEIRSPDSGAFDWTEVRQFNLMFSTQLGALAGKENNAIYLRPETAQGIFVNFNYVRDVSRQAIPFGIAQIGKAFRNEIVARQFIFRMREFEQMEMQYFVKPGEHQKAFEQWRDERLAWHKSIGIASDKLRIHVHEKLAHYADAAVDIEYHFPIGWQEIEGIHSRTDFDLRQHQEHSGKKLEYFDPQTKERFVPYVVETSAGLDRTILMVLCEAYAEEKVEGETRTVMRFHPKVAPMAVAILPLVKKEPMQRAARSIESSLRQHYNCFYDERGAIGRRYRRMDEIGTPFCITTDGQTEDDDTVTLRERDSMQQERIATKDLAEILRKRLA